MKIFIKSHPFHYEIENLTRVFFPNEKLEIVKDGTGGAQRPYIVTCRARDGAYARLTAELHFEGCDREESAQMPLDAPDFDDNCERALAIVLFRLLTAYTGITPPWGILTGVRPIKLFRSLSEQYGRDGARVYFEDMLLVSKEKTNLACVTEANERKILDLSQKDSFSLYLSIPFCPSRCSYCSFVSQSVEKAQKLIAPYTDLLCKEIEYTGKLAKKLGLRLETVYMGGGTPTTLSAQQLKQVIGAVREHFDLSHCREFTVEAGRPDTITEEKLAAIRQGGCDRISINPQTLSDEVLARIGRKHTAQEAVDAFQMARRAGFTHINTDLIAGLPQEPFESFRDTLQKILALSPESITVHTLAMKKSSRLTGEGMEIYKEDAHRAFLMHRLCAELLPENGYFPYYLYRQSKMVGNLENVGWSIKKHEGLYNVYVMDETHTILGCGAGAVTKLKQPAGTYLERIFNFKYPYEYINRFDEMLRRKERAETFYDQYFK